MIILGIDPGTATLGYGLIKTKGRDLKALDYGCVTTDPKEKPCVRLKKINSDLNSVIKKYKPNIVAVEKLYFFKNLKTAMPVSQAKGVVLLTAAKKKIPVYEFTPLEVKMAVSGYGRAEKKQVQKMIQTILNLEEKPKDKDKRKDDATDALGVALCYILSMNGKIKLS